MDWAINQPLQGDHVQLSFFKYFENGQNSRKVQNPVIKILIRCGHFDIWGSWDLQVNWKNVTTLISEPWILMGEKSKVQIKAPLIHLTSPRHPWTPWTKISSNTQLTFPLSPRNSLRHSQALPRQSERLLFGQGWSEGLWAKWGCQMIYVEC